MDRADFLQMLTAQLKAQDPMNPLNGQDFATQLATFSSVQELQGISTTMDQSLQANLLIAQTFNNTMAAGLIGKTVRADLDQFSVGSSGTSTLTYNLGAAATDISIDVKDSSGSVVRTIKVNGGQVQGEHSYEWDGLGANGQRVPAGTYSFAVHAKSPDGADVQATTFKEGRVSEVRYVDGNAVLVVDGTVVQLGQVLTIRDADGKKG